MDFIEKIFGIAPDGGDGSFELLLFLVPLVGIALIALGRRSFGRSARRRSRRDPN